MSTFCGIMMELPTLRVDRFNNDVTNAEAFFLTHCHTDHMIGLNSSIFQEELINKSKLLYASPISCAILKRRFPRIIDKIMEIPLNSPITIFLKDQWVSVTAISAGHCPGSLMFLFETESCKVLYTGDYRINSKDVRKFTAFYEVPGNVKSIDKIYLDTTFFLKSYLKFPTREASLNMLVALIHEWINKSKAHTVKLMTSAKYGSEYVFKEIYEKLRMPICVNEEVFDFYSLIPDLDQAVTTESSVTQICSSYFKVRSKTTYDEEKEKVRIINTSAMRWQQENLENGICMNKNGTHHLCYSTHASFEEGMALLEFLKPKKIHPCVDQRDPADQKRMLKLIEDSLSRLEENSRKTENIIPLFKTVDNVIADSNFKKKAVCDSIGASPNKITKFANILDSPPR